jgi:hypothetical protein
VDSEKTYIPRMGYPCASLLANEAQFSPLRLAAFMK